MVLVMMTLAMLLTSLAAHAADAPVTVNVDGFRTRTGVVLVSVYSSGEGFPMEGDKALLTTSIPVEPGACSTTLQLPLGRYAVALVHDEDADGELDTNFLGIPREGLGASNNAKGFFGPPSFDDAGFDVTAGGVTQRITLQYL